MMNEDEKPEGPVEVTERQSLANGYLTPRHRRFCQLAAQGMKNSEIGELLGYVDSRVSILLKHPAIMTEIARLQNRIFEETIIGRLKAMADPALAIFEATLQDRTNRVKHSEKIDVAKWIIEKLDGKAVQKHDHGSSILGNMLDRLDSLRGTGKTINDLPEVIDVDVRLLTESPAKDGESAEDKEEETLTDWILDFDTPRK